MKKLRCAKTLVNKQVLSDLRVIDQDVAWLAHWLDNNGYPQLSGKPCQRAVRAIQNGSYDLAAAKGRCKSWASACLLNLGLAILFGCLWVLS